MATDLEGNVQLQKFIALLSDLNHQTADAYASGKIDVIHKMNKTILDMYAIQHGNEEEAYAAIDGDADIIYQNFNAIITMLKSSKDPTSDPATQVSVKKFLKNIFDANIRILTAYGLI